MLNIWNKLIFNKYKSIFKFEKMFNRQILDIQEFSLQSCLNCITFLQPIHKSYLTLFKIVYWSVFIISTIFSLANFHHKKCWKNPQSFEKKIHTIDRMHPNFSSQKQNISILAKNCFLLPFPLFATKYFSKSWLWHLQCNG